MFGLDLFFALITALVFALLLWVYIRRLFARTRKAEQAAARADADKTRFISHVGHEIRNPLNAILGMSELLVQGTLPQEKREQTLVIRSAADTLLMVATNLLGFFGGADTPKNSTPFNLSELMMSVRDALAHVAFEKRLQLNVQIEPESPNMVLTDGNYVRHIVSNVIAHAVALTEKGQVEVTVHATDEADDKTWEGARITVADTGPAFSPSAVAALFEPYGLTDRFPGGNPLGTGLNMYNAQLFAKALGGSVSYRPHATIGGLYEIVIPLKVLSRVVAVSENMRGGTVVPINDPYVRHRAQLAKKHILVAEDQRSNQQALASILGNAGHSVVIAKTGDEALNRLEQENFDVVLIDLRLPEISGIDVIKLWHTTDEERSQKTPFIVLTGEPSEKTMQACFAAGAAAFLAKPASAQRLLDTLVTVCNRTFLEQLGPATTDIDSTAGRVAVSVERIGLAPAALADHLRDALRYVSEIETAAASKDWSSVRLRARAIRGTAHSMGATNLIIICKRIIDLSDTGLDDNWPVIMNELEKTLDEARKGLAVHFKKPLPTA